MKSFSAYITEAPKGVKGFDDPWAVMSPEDRKEAFRLFKASMKSMPGSPRQKELFAKLMVLYKKYNIGQKKEEMGEDWSLKYKRKIDCDNPKGFSQKAHCQGRKKK